MKAFTLDGFERWAKDLEISCNADSDLRLSVDWDDVDHLQTAMLLSKALRILNDHWDDPEYAGMVEEYPDYGGDDEAEAIAYDERSAKADALMEALTHA